MRSIKLFSALALFACGACFAAESYALWDGHESVADYAQRTGLEPEKSIDLGGGVKLELVLIPAGRFVMGTPEPRKPEFTVLSAQLLIGAGGLTALALLALLFIRKRAGRRFAFSLSWLLAFCLACSVIVWGGTRLHLARKQARQYMAALANYKSGEAVNERPAHPVLISKPFYMGKYEVTRGQFEAVMGTKPSALKFLRYPITSISWNDAAAFCDTVKSKSKTALELPTEAQWEYACRAGTATAFNTGDKLKPSDALFDGKYVVPVGSYKPNAFGLYDMHGNACEWCRDFYDPDYYRVSPEIDPPGPAKSGVPAIFRVHRGGSGCSYWVNCRSASRYGAKADITGPITGFRCVLPLYP